MGAQVPGHAAVNLQLQSRHWKGNVLPCLMDPTDLADPRTAVGVKGQLASGAEGGPPEPHGTHPSAPHHHTALPVYGGSLPHDAAVAGPRHPHPKLPQPHGRGHVGIQQCFFGTLECLQQAHPHILNLKWTPPG